MQFGTLPRRLATTSFGEGIQQRQGDGATCVRQVDKNRQDDPFVSVSVHGVTVITAYRVAVPCLTVV